MGIEPGIFLVTISHINHYTTNTLKYYDIDMEVFTPGKIPRLNLGQYPGWTWENSQGEPGTILSLNLGYIPAIAGKTNLGQFPAIAGKKPC